MSNWVITVIFPDGERVISAFQCPDHAMYAGMPGNYELRPSPMIGWEFEKRLRDGRWVATERPAPVKPPMTTRVYRVVMISNDPPNADELRDCILDATGFPLVYDDHPEYLVVEEIPE